MSGNRAPHATHTYTERTDHMISTHEHHNPGCTGGPQKSRIESDGNERIRCRSCAAFWYVSPVADATPDLDVDTPIITRQVSRQVCREHHEQDVTPTGKGCQVCAASRQTWRDRRQSRRRRSRQVE
jgi:hypothetical protein